MKVASHFAWMAVAGIAALLGATVLARATTNPDREGAQAPLVALYLVGQEEELLAIPGVVQAARRSELAFQFGGSLVDLPVVAGQRVAAGAILARIDPRDLENRVMLEKARLNLARADFDRFRRLRESPSAPVSPADVDRKRALFEIAQVRTAQAGKNLQEATLRAPFDGVVAARMVDNHAQIRARQPVLLIEASELLEVVIDLPERVVARVRATSRDVPVGEVQFAVLPERRYPVHLAEIATRADPSTQTFRVTLTLERPRDVNLLPGMSAIVYARPEIVSEDTLRVPVTAIFRSDTGQSALWVVDPATHRIERRDVSLLDEDNTRSVVVVDGLRPGERIVAVGAGELQAGSVVRAFRPGMLSE